MVLYHQDRIERDHVPDLRASFKAYDTARTGNNSDAPGSNLGCDSDLCVLRTLLFERNLNERSAFEKHSSLVVTTYNLRRMKHVEEELHSSPTATSKSKCLWLSICQLARLQVAFQVFKDIALTLPSFEHVTIILVPCPVAPAIPSSHPLNLHQAFRILKLDLNSATVKAVLGQNQTVAKAKPKFVKLQRQRLNIHAEVQMLMFLSTTELSASGLFPYFGCSKLSCFMCDRFLQSYGRFTTRGCHGRLFKPWTVPSVDRLLPGHAGRTAKALISVQNAVKQKLKESVQGHIPLERTSLVGGSSISGGWLEESSQRKLQMDRLRMKAECDRVAELFRR